MYPYHYPTHELARGYGGEVLGLLFVVAIVVLVVLAIRHFMGHGDAASNGVFHRHNALSILQERYAKGEIDTEEYEERSAVLGGKKPAPKS